jgi:hypothetical protein
MRIQKVFTIIVLMGLFLIPFDEAISIQPAMAEGIDPPRSNDGRRLDQDVVDDDLLPPPQYEQTGAGVTPDIVDEALGLTPPFTPATTGGDAPNNTQNLPSPSSKPDAKITDTPSVLMSGMSIRDNFERADGAIGSNWTVRDGYCNVSSNAAVCGDYGRATFNGALGDGNAAEADIAVAGTALQYTGLLLNYGAGVSNIFLKVQQQSPYAGQFTHAACYTGNSSGGSSFGLGFFALTSPFSTAHMKATRAGDTVTIVFSNVDGGAQPSQTYVCNGAPPAEGNGIGILGFSGIARLDNFGMPGRCDSTLWNNGPLVTHPGGGYNGAAASALQTALGMTTYGFGDQFSVGNRMADDFTVSDPHGWQVDNLTFYAYQTATYTDPPPSTITGIYYQIWDGPPNDPGSSVIFGDLVTNRMTSTSWANIYRVKDDEMGNNTRPIMANVVSAGVFLPPGTYWLDWTTDGSGTSGPWAPPISILGQTTTGNALQYTQSSTSWGPALDTGIGTQQGMPFLVQGCKEIALWNQPLSSVNTNPYVNQEFPDSPDYSSFLADDFIANNPWMIETIFFPGNGWNGFTTLANASALTFQIYANNAGIPAGDPSGSGDPPIWTLTLPITDPHITLYTGSGGYPSNTMLKLPTPFSLPAGHYWLTFYPTLNFSPYGQFGRQAADTTSAYIGKLINPGGGFGLGTDWQNWTVLGPTQTDIAFRLGGKILVTYLPLIMK